METPLQRSHKNRRSSSSVQFYRRTNDDWWSLILPPTANEKKTNEKGTLSTLYPKKVGTLRLSACRFWNFIFSWKKMWGGFWRAPDPPPTPFVNPPQQKKFRFPRVPLWFFNVFKICMRITVKYQKVFASFSCVFASFSKVFASFSVVSLPFHLSSTTKWETNSITDADEQRFLRDPCVRQVTLIFGTYEFAALMIVKQNVNGKILNISRLRSLSATS